MDIRKVKKLIELVEESGISELEIHEGEESVRISRHGQVNGQPIPFAQAVPAAASTATPSPPPLKQSSVAEGSEAIDDAKTIRSPMVGTYYEAPSPEVAPFVQKGQRVKLGDTLCIIEAMKILNQIEADREGVIVEILAENGQPVEYGQPLFVMD